MIANLFGRRAAGSVDYAHSGLVSSSRHDNTHAAASRFTGPRGQYIGIADPVVAVARDLENRRKRTGNQDLSGAYIPQLKPSRGLWKSACMAVSFMGIDMCIMCRGAILNTKGRARLRAEASQKGSSNSPRTGKYLM